MQIRRWHYLAMMFAALVLGATKPAVGSPYWVKWSAGGSFGGAGTVGVKFALIAETNAPLGSGFELRIIGWKTNWVGNRGTKKVVKVCNSGQSCAGNVTTREPGTLEFQAELIQKDGTVVARSEIAGFTFVRPGIEGSSQERWAALSRWARYPNGDPPRGYTYRLGYGGWTLAAGVPGRD